jgi:hypothetical protein
MIFTVFAVTGKVSRSLCFEGVFHTIRKVLVISGKTRQQQRNVSVKDLEARNVPIKRRIREYGR